MPHSIFRQRSSTVAEAMTKQRQFGISTLLFTVALCAVVSLWIAGWLRRREAIRRVWQPWNKSSVRVTVETNVPQHSFSYDGPGVMARGESESTLDRSARHPVPIDVELLRNVQQLRFANAHFDDDAIKRLCSVKQLSDLRIKSSLVPPDVIRQLQDLPLVRLDLVNCHVSDEMLDGCEYLQQLRILYLVDNDLSDACVDRLMSLKQLVRLDLRDNLISKPSLERLQQGLPGCTINSGSTTIQEALTMTIQKALAAQEMNRRAMNIPQNMAQE